jgi:hypothetical protein
MLAEIALLNECKRENSMFDKNIRVNGAYVAMLIVVVTFVALSITVDEFAVLFGIVGIGKYALPFTLVPALMLTALFEIFKAISGFGVKKKKRKANNKNRKKPSIRNKDQNKKSAAKTEKLDGLNDWITEDVDADDEIDDKDVKP